MLLKKKRVYIHKHNLTNTSSGTLEKGPFSMLEAWRKARRYWQYFILNCVRFSLQVTKPTLAVFTGRNSTLCIYTKHTQVIDQLMKLFHVIPTYLKFTSMASFSKKSLLTDQGWSVYKVIRKSNLGYLLPSSTLTLLLLSPVRTGLPPNQ